MGVFTFAPEKYYLDVRTITKGSTLSCKCEVTCAIKGNTGQVYWAIEENHVSLSGSGVTIFCHV